MAVPGQVIVAHSLPVDNNRGILVLVRVGDLPEEEVVDFGVAVYHDLHSLQLFVSGDFGKNGQQKLVKLGQESQLRSNVGLNFAHVCQVGRQQCVHSVLSNECIRMKELTKEFVVWT